MPSDRRYYTTITGLATQIAQDESNITLLLDLSLLPTDRWTNIEDGGGSLEIWSSDGLTRYPIDVLSCNKSLETGFIKLYVPLSSSIDNNFRLYYNKAGSSQPSPSDTYGQYNSYSTNCKAFYSLDYTPTGLSNDTIDRTVNQNHGTSNGNVTNCMGKIGNGFDFNAENSYSELPSSLKNITAGTIFLWFKSTNLVPGVEGHIFSQRTNGINDRLYIKVAGSGNLVFGFGSDTDAINSGVSVKQDNIWHFATITWDSSTCYGYLDNAFVGQANATLGAGTPTIRLNSYPFLTNLFFGDCIDHVAIFHEKLSTNTLLTIYNNLNDNASFWTIGSEVDTQPVEPVVLATDSEATGFRNNDYTYKVEDFQYVDDNGDEITKVRIESLPALGELKLNDVAVLVDDEIDITDIENLTFTPVASGWGTPYTTFTFNVYTTEWSVNTATFSQYVQGDPITDIIEEMESMISSVSRPTYQVDWGTVGERNENRQTSYPAAVVDYENERNTDFDGTGSEVFAAINQATIKITIYDTLLKESNYAIEDIRRKLLIDLVTLKKLFFNNNTLNSKCDHIKYDNNEPKITIRNDRTQASTLECMFIVQYQQGHAEPANRR